MRILILGAGKMGTFFADALSFQHEVGLYDVDPKKTPVRVQHRTHDPVGRSKSF